VVGDRVTIKCGVQLWDGVRLADDVFVGPNATFTNDAFPRSKQHPANYPVTKIGAGASIGANATILPGIEIGSHSMVGAGAVVTRSVPPYAIVMGNPARITGYVESSRQAPAPVASSLPTAVEVGSRVKGVKLLSMPKFEDLRGALTAAEFPKTLPFTPQRIFLVYRVPGSEVRGEHAHRECQQFLVCVHGQVSVVVDDGTSREEFLLNDPTLGCYIPPMVWATQYRYSADAVMLVLASHIYDADDYLRSYNDYLANLRR